MATGTVKWFNARRASGSFNRTPAALTFSSISAPSNGRHGDLNEGQKIAYEVVADRRTGKSSADNLKPA
jgi:cold shock protein